MQNFQYLNSYWAPRDYCSFCQSAVWMLCTLSLIIGCQLSSILISEDFLRSSQLRRKVPVKLRPPCRAHLPPQTLASWNSTAVLWTSFPSKSTFFILFSEHKIEGKRCKSNSGNLCQGNQILIRAVRHTFVELKGSYSFCFLCFT